MIKYIFIPWNEESYQQLLLDQHEQQQLFVVVVVVFVPIFVVYDLKTEIRKSKNIVAATTTRYFLEKE
jgi:hypothetical protein